MSFLNFRLLTFLGPLLILALTFKISSSHAQNDVKARSTVQITGWSGLITYKYPNERGLNIVAGDHFNPLRLRWIDCYKSQGVNVLNSKYFELTLVFKKNPQPTPGKEETLLYRDLIPLSEIDEFRIIDENTAEITNINGTKAVYNGRLIGANIELDKNYPVISKSTRIHNIPHVYDSCVEALIVGKSDGLIDGPRPEYLDAFRVIRILSMKRTAGIEESRRLFAPLLPEQREKFAELAAIRVADSARIAQAQAQAKSNYSAYVSESDRLSAEKLKREREVLEAFRSNLKSGDRTTCGLVVEVKSEIALIQLESMTKWISKAKLLPINYNLGYRVCEH